MSSTLHHTMKNGAESVREGTEHTLAGTLSAMVKGVDAVSGVVAMLRNLTRDDGLAWLGLARRRPLRSAVMFSAGLAVGAGLGVLFAPMSGADLRRRLLAGERKDRARAVTGDVEQGADDAKANNTSHAVHDEAGNSAPSAI